MTVCGNGAAVRGWCICRLKRIDQPMAVRSDIARQAHHPRTA
ncbi:MAG: hypothetical protein VB030_08460 [Eubacterium aggregans]|nr:hypothetical protein [Eubacterium aggregans]